MIFIQATIYFLVFKEKLMMLVSHDHSQINSLKINRLLKKWEKSMCFSHALNCSFTLIESGIKILLPNQFDYYLCFHLNNWWDFFSLFIWRLQWSHRATRVTISVIVGLFEYTADQKGNGFSCRFWFSFGRTCRFPSIIWIGPTKVHKTAG